MLSLDRGPTFRETNDPELLQNCISGNLGCVESFHQLVTEEAAAGCVRREGEGWTRWAPKMKIEEMNKEVVYRCSQRDNGERHPCLTSDERSCGISTALSKWKVNGGLQERQRKSCILTFLTFTFSRTLLELLNNTVLPSTALNRF